MSAQQKQRDEMETKIMVDYPEINPFVLRNLLDLYFSEDGKVTLDNIVKDNIKRERKSKSVVKKEPVKEIITNIEVRRWEDTDFEGRINKAKGEVFKIISTEEVEPVAQ